MFAHYPLSSLGYLMVTDTHPIAGNLPIETLVAKQLQTNVYTYTHTCMHACAHVYIRTYAHRYFYAHTCKRTTCTHTHTHTPQAIKHNHLHVVKLIFVQPQSQTY